MHHYDHKYMYAAAFTKYFWKKYVQKVFTDKFFFASNYYNF